MAPSHPVTPVEHAQAVAAFLAPLRTRIELPSAAETMPLAEAEGRILAADVLSTVAVPPFANSQMDGYAVRSADLASAGPDSPVRLPVGRTSAAGDPIGELREGTAAPVMTGAPIPAGADAVVPIEAADPPRFLGIGSGTGSGSGTDRHDVPEGTTVAFAAPVAPGSFVRAAGADLVPGAVILTVGTRLGPAQLGSLAAAGIAEAPVRPRPVVLLLSTGHELRPPGESLGSGQIHDANTASLSAALRESGAVVATAFAPDDADALLAVVLAHPEADLVLTTGGVSAGAFEVVRDALEPVGVAFGPVAMQPGGPQGLGIARLALGDAVRDAPVIAFPGNPVSALLSFEMFLRPVLRGIAGLPPRRPVQIAPLAHALSSPVGKHQVRRGAMRGDGSVEVGAPGSHLLHDYARATVLVHVPIGVDALPAGAEVEVWRIDE
ncbi:molybdopterin molybdotransferase [Microbacterium resistens]|uniref:Molybdopterin molybdenumtransferase n=1 Tax=Microbacterium resistens TaxID=156977 RepID=A0ABU1SDP1_9MICO|nr:gephyrin-like molybdotransferase Glp [Microbacterium resistens]MDR6867733.1 molybdopterin molybdotransferase [Microbacterium resistens]